MRAPLLDSLGRDRVGTSHPAFIDVAVKGWNTRDALAGMDPQFAPVLDNWFPRFGELELRGGMKTFATGVTGGVKTLYVYSPESGAAQKFFAASNSGIFNVTAGGAAGAAVSACTNGYWHFLTATNSTGTTFLWGANGTDKVKLYDGTTWVDLDGTSTPAITGITTTTINFPWLFKHRIFFTQKNSMNLWFLGIDAIAGAAQSLPLGNLFRKGGYLVSGTNWTLDSGNGPDDLLAVITSEGQLGVFQGTDPTDATKWALVGIWDVGKPLSPRCFFPLGGDVCAMVESGVYPLSRLLQSGVVNFKTALTNPIQPTVSSTIATVGTTTQGWCGVLYPQFDALLINVPGQSLQWVMNTVTGALCSFSGWAATAFIVKDGLLFYGAADGKVYKAWDGVEVSDNGIDIVTTAHLAYSDFKLPTELKRVELFRPLLSYDGPVEMRHGVSTDFNDLVITNVIPREGTNPGTPWDTSPWDTSDWSPSVIRQRKWRTAAHVPAYSLALWLQTASNTSKLSWSGTNAVISVGGML